MCKNVFLLLLLSCCSGAAVLQAQSRRIDTTMKIGKAGYRLTCNNRNPEKNDAAITPIGFEKHMNEFGFEVKGRIRKAEVDDLNNDGFPDMVIYVYSGDTLNKGTVIGIHSEKNETVAPIIFPDIVDDQKLKEGYKGHDEFSLMEGMLMRRFPVYTSDSANARPSGKIRQIQYRVVPGERGMLKFKVLRSYEYTKQ